MVSYLIFGLIIFVIGIGIIIFSIVKDRKNKGKDEEQIASPKQMKSVVNLIEVTGYDQEERCYIMKEGRFMDLLQVQSKDLVSSSSDEVEYDILKFCKTYRLYEDDLKIVSMNFPCDTKVQQEYLKHKKEQTTNPIFKKCLADQISELIWLEKNRTTREYYFMIFADSIDNLQENKRTLKAVLHTGRDGLVSEISDKKKHQILYRLNNKCSQVA